MFLTRYLILDILKVALMHDPYFLSLGPSYPLPTKFPAVLAAHPLLLRFTRLIAVFFIVRFALEIIFAACALLTCGLLGPRYLGLRAAPHHYAPFYGPFNAVAAQGLAGFWGVHWHQLLRAGLEAPGASLVKWRGWSPRSARAKFTTAGGAFLCSACVHASGRYMATGMTEPGGWKSAAFFTLQIVGVVGEAVIVEAWKRTGFRDGASGWVRQGLTFALVAAWLLLTAPLFADDVARGGVFLFEPVPISAVRAVGFGGKDGSIWRWTARNIFWHVDEEHWYKSGLAL